MSIASNRESHNHTKSATQLQAQIASQFQLGKRDKAELKATLIKRARELKMAWAAYLKAAFDAIMSIPSKSALLSGNGFPAAV